MCEHLVHPLVEILGVLFGIVGKGVAGRASPNQILSLGVEQIDDQRTDPVGFSGRRCVSESSPTPTSTKAVVKSVESLLIPRDLHRYDRDIAARIHLGPAFGC
jgi:hypothetical protein